MGGKTAEKDKEAEKEHQKLTEKFHLGPWPAAQLTHTKQDYGRLSRKDIWENRSYKKIFRGYTVLMRC